MTARSDLEKELRGPTAATDLLSESETADLVALFRAARQQEKFALAEAIDGMIGALPRPLRGVTKRIMFGDAVD
ncbi:hypothetical protein BJY24_006673 [Nocardia transvalensis]|uniref:Uncharacterized protein n=1 Tax=Nocardia transvalensis TaxID=37333 RepID=A0A7W9ULN8_9NOCA|nr:hypothetical protein [Nocardia transvalensis]MBB5917761.1 hypothetical protein [Nocardia transvalensis]